MWSGHELGYWARLSLSAIIIIIIISWLSRLWLVIYANASTISNVSIMTCDCDTENRDMDTSHRRYQ